MLKHFSQNGMHVFKTAVESGTFRAAAKQLYISQPAVSGHIHRIEEELGVELFERPYGKKLRLTDVGEAVYFFAVDLFAKQEELQNTIQELLSGARGEVKLAIHIGKYLIPTLATAFHKQYPGIMFSLQTGNSEGVQKSVLNGEVDFGVSIYANNQHLDFLPFYKEPFIMVCSPNHPLALEKNISKEKLKEHGFITGINWSESNSLLRYLFDYIGIRSENFIFKVESPETMLQVVEEGGGIGFLLHSTAKKAITENNIVQLSLEKEIKLPSIDVYMVFRQGTRLTHAASLFKNFLKSEICNYSPSITLIN